RYTGRYKLNQRAERRSCARFCACAATNPGTANGDSAKHSSDLPLMPALDAQPCITLIAERVRRGDGPALMLDEIALRGGKQRLALGQRHPQGVGRQFAVNDGQARSFRLSELVDKASLDGRLHDSLPLAAEWLNSAIPCGRRL